MPVPKKGASWYGDDLGFREKVHGKVAVCLDVDIFIFVGFLALSDVRFLHFRAEVAPYVGKIVECARGYILVGAFLQGGQ